MNESRPDIARTVLTVLFIVALIFGSFWILLPFLGALIWATTIVVTTWPVLEWLQKRLWGKRSLAVALLTLVLLGAVFVPFLAAVGTIVGNVDEVAARAKALAALEVPPVAPEWVRKIPLVGSNLATSWERYGGQGIKDVAAVAAPFAAKAREVVRGESRGHRTLPPPFPDDGRRLRRPLVQRRGSGRCA